MAARGVVLSHCRVRSEKKKHNIYPSIPVVLNGVRYREKLRGGELDSVEEGRRVPVFWVKGERAARGFSAATDFYYKKEGSNGGHEKRRLAACVNEMLISKN